MTDTIQERLRAARRVAMIVQFKHAGEWVDFADGSFAILKWREVIEAADEIDRLERELAEAKAKYEATAKREQNLILRMNKAIFALDDEFQPEVSDD